MVLTVDGQSWSANEGQAIIRTPELRAGQDHYYQLKMEVVRRNERLTLTRDIAFRAGQDLQVEFEEPAACMSPSAVSRQWPAPSLHAAVRDRAQRFASAPSAR